MANLLQKDKNIKVIYTITMKILISSGEPAGIGPDIILKYHSKFVCRQVILGNIALFRERAKILNLEVNIREYLSQSDNLLVKNDTHDLWIWNIALKSPCQPGMLNSDNAAYVLELLKTGATACINGEFEALVTAPVHKGIIADAGFAFTGHTEYFAELTNTSEVVMMLASEGLNKLRVALVTTHLPLRDVPDAITPEKLTRVIAILNYDLKRYFNLLHPCIYVAGLNPHAGENGHLGNEEIAIIEPVIKKMRLENNIDLKGPFPADTLFTQHYLEQADVFLAMYHDQGLSVIKYAAFEEAVNVTLGLPFIRTSVDHGTALDLAGTGKASEKSLICAIEMAIKMVKAKEANKNYEKND